MKYYAQLIIRCIGSSKDIAQRWYGHKCALKSNTHHSPHLQNAWNKYGANSFKFKIIEQCSEVELLIREQYHLNILKSWEPTIGFNISKNVRAGRGKIGNSITLKNSITGEIVTRLSQRKFAKEFRLNEASLGGLIKGKNNKCREWVLPDNKSCRVYEVLDPNEILPIYGSKEIYY